MFQKILLVLIILNAHGAYADKSDLGTNAREALANKQLILSRHVQNLQKLKSVFKKRSRAWGIFFNYQNSLIKQNNDSLDSLHRAKNFYHESFLNLKNSDFESAAARADFYRQAFSYIEDFKVHIDDLRETSSQISAKIHFSIWHSQYDILVRYFLEDMKNSTMTCELLFQKGIGK